MQWKAVDVKLLQSPSYWTRHLKYVCYHSAASEALYNDHGGMSFNGNFEEDEEEGDGVEGLVDDEIEEVMADRVDGKTTGEVLTKESTKQVLTKESTKQERMTCVTYPTVEEEDEDIDDP